MTNEKAIIDKYREQISLILKADDWKLIEKNSKVPYDEKLQLGTYELRLAQLLVASFQLHPMVNCCGICVSTQAWVNDNFRNKGLGTILNAMRIDIARELGYGLLLCTDVEQNEYQRKVLKRNGWRDIHKFVNPRTKNTIFISVINL